MRALFALITSLTLLASAPSAVLAADPVLVGPSDGPQGRPHVVLDRLEVPATLPEHQRISKVLEKLLKHEQHRVQWGAGRDSRITYRFYLERLDLSVERGVLKVRCTALGKLPKGKTARSKLEFGGDPKDPRKVVDHVLGIVARGVLARLADLERDRRSRH